MSHPASGNSTPTPGHGLPARPPPSQASAFSFKPRNVASAAKPAAASAPQQTAYQGGGYDVTAATTYTGQSSQNHYAQAGYGQGYQQNESSQGYGAYYGGGHEYSQYPQNSQAWPGTNSIAQTGAYNQAEVDWQQQVNAWQSNFSQSGEGSATKANKTPLGGNGTNVPTKSATALPNVPDSRKTVVRSGGGQKWEDPSLLEWGNHHRLFIGNLAGEVTDESLLKAFNKYPSVQKARVIRDKRTTKSKGFGFISFSDADEYFQAAKEMQGKYIGSHPVLIKRADTEIKATNKKGEDRGNKPKHNNNNRGSSTNGNGQGGAIRKEAVLGPQSGGGVQKTKKVESKYKLLG